jgi:hypothetical protein
MFIGKAGAFLSAVPRWSHGENEEQRFGGVGERGAVQCRHSFLQRTASPLHVHMIWAVGVGEELLFSTALVCVLARTTLPLFAIDALPARRVPWFGSARYSFHIS